MKATLRIPRLRRLRLRALAGILFTVVLTLSLSLISPGGLAAKSKQAAGPPTDYTAIKTSANLRTHR